MARELERARAHGEDPLVLVGMGRLNDADELLFVQLQSPGECGSAGCNTVSFRYTGDRWVRIMDTVGGTVSDRRFASSRYAGPDRGGAKPIDLGRHEIRRIGSHISQVSVRTANRCSESRIPTGRIQSTTRQTASASPRLRHRQVVAIHPPADRIPYRCRVAPFLPLPPLGASNSVPGRRAKTVWQASAMARAGSPGYRSSARSQNSHASATQPRPGGPTSLSWADLPRCAAISETSRETPSERCISMATLQRTIASWPSCEPFAISDVGLLALKTDGNPGRTNSGNRNGPATALLQRHPALAEPGQAGPDLDGAILTAHGMRSRALCGRWNAHVRGDQWLRALAKGSGPQLTQFDIHDAIAEVQVLTSAELRRHGVVLHMVT